MMRSLQGGPVTNLLYECKQRLSSSCGILNGFIRAYHFLCGGKLILYQGLLLLPFMLYETARTQSGPAFFRGLLVPLSAFCVAPYLWVNATAGEITSSLFDELVLVARLVERDVPKQLKRRTGRVVCIARIYFWWVASSSVAVILPLVMGPFTSDTLPIDVPLPDSELVGRIPSDTFFVLMSAWQSWILVYMAIGFGWVDSVFFVATLVIYSLTILLAESFRRVDCKASNIFPLIQAHQTILNAGQVCSQIMSQSCLIITAVAIYLIVVTGFSIMFELGHASGDRIIDMVLVFVAIIRLGIISDLMTEASLEVATALYESPWTDTNAPIHGNAKSPSNVRHLMLMVMLRAQKPLSLRAGMFGTLSNEFILQFLRALYTYFQALQNFVANHK